MVSNLTSHLPAVNIHFKKTSFISGSILSSAYLSLALVSGFAHAESPMQRAIINATNLTNVLHAVDDSKLQVALDGIKSGKIPRVDPDQPVWVIETINGRILYYQGQDNFEGQPASKLVDDSGFRFGSKALENAAVSKSSWLSIMLNGKSYSAYCVSRTPTIVCSLVL